MWRFDATQALSLLDGAEKMQLVRPEAIVALRPLIEAHSRERTTIQSAGYRPEKERELLEPLDKQFDAAVDSVVETVFHAELQALAQAEGEVKRRATGDPEPTGIGEYVTETQKQQRLQRETRAANRLAPLMAAVGLLPTPASLLDHFENVLLMTDDPMLIYAASTAITGRLDALRAAVSTEPNLERRHQLQQPFEDALRRVSRELEQRHITSPAEEMRRLAKRRQDLELTKARQREYIRQRVGLDAWQPGGGLTIGSAFDQKPQLPVEARTPVPGAMVVGEAFERRPRAK